jgi:hypothetical protein
LEHGFGVATALTMSYDLKALRDTFDADYDTGAEKIIADDLGLDGTTRRANGVGKW